MAAQIQSASAPAVFNFQSHEVRTVLIGDAVWFVCTDVAKALGYVSTKDAARHLDNDEKGSSIVRTLGGDQSLTIINESGLYALVLRSRKPEARKFAKWVTAEVLPAIRKTGRYEAAPYVQNPGDSLTVDPERQARIDRRAWELARQTYDAAREQMPSCEYLKRGLVEIENWHLPSQMQLAGGVLLRLKLATGMCESYLRELKEETVRVAKLAGIDNPAAFG